MTHSYIPAEIGMKSSEIDTPALVIDLNALEYNIKIMAEFCREKNINLRPHAKTHKSVDIAAMQIAQGAVGICCQKVSEAEALVSGGIPDIFITNEIVGKRKIAKLVDLAQKARLSVCVDNSDNIMALNEAACQAGIRLNTFVEVDIGGGRCGTPPGKRAAQVAGIISDSANLSFAGIQVYHGKAQHIKAFTERRNAIRASLGQVSYTLDFLKQDNIDCPVITGAGTGSYLFETEGNLYTELQCGSYIFMDVDYGSITMEAGNKLDSFQNSLFVLTSIMSTPATHMAVCDAGLKAHSIDSGLPVVKDFPSVVYQQPSDEHGVLVDQDNVLSLGDKLYLVPGHCDPTVNLHDWYIGVRNGYVESIWPVSARGMVF